MGAEVGELEGVAVVGMGVGAPGVYVGAKVGEQVGSAVGFAVGFGVGSPGL